jgi:hypothetical protein
MPIEISEISVHIAIGDGARAVPVPPQEPAMTPERMEALVRACVHDVLRTIAMQQAR